jgi:hypothetical protein
MNKIMKHFRHFWFALALLATLIFGCRCSTAKPDPLAGWTHCKSQDPKGFGKITADCDVYINSLPNELRVGVGPVEYLEDKTGQHAIRFETGENGESWSYVLIYDASNNRIKTTKYLSGHYRS